MIPVISVVGKSDAGKTTLLEKLIRELKARGYRVATVKHDAHSFELDHPGKDTWRHAQAGSDHVVIASPTRIAHIQRIERELTLPEIVATITDADIILTEGYKRGPAQKIEVSRAEKGRELLCNREELIAIASDQRFEMDVPQFGLDDAAGLVDLIEQAFSLRPSREKSRGHLHLR
jgi:molybdopterin-guanine dinucleotide biosynthesis protein B